MNPVNIASIIQAARGPILLITVGVLMVVDYNTPFSFGRTWPALIIIFGILKLLERMAGPPPAPAYTPGVPPGFQPPPTGYQGTGYQGPGYQGSSYQGSGYEAGPGYQVPPQNPGGNPQ